MKISNQLQGFWKGALFGGIVALVYCGLFSFIAKQFDLAPKDYALWMGLSAGVVVGALRMLLKLK